MVNCLDGKVAIVTGGAGGIGAASVKTLAKQGAKVAVIDLDLKSAESVCEAVNADGGKAIAVEADIADESSVIAMVEQVSTSFGRIDVLYNNAAALGFDMQQHDGAVADMPVETWDKAMAVNLRGPMLCAKHAIPVMLSQNGGNIINASSGMGVQGEVTRSAYAASKAAIIMLTKSIAAQYGHKGVRANAIQIGYLPPPPGSKKTTPPQVSKILAAHHLIPYDLTAQHIADVVLFLASEQSAALTGSLIVADGGFSAHTPSMNEINEFVRSVGQNSI
ncbi:SDR family NAD(P)-dependent oxidoreductase [Litorimonas sp.]|uniref:SDR family NAD(P)-dependent oxidoreductase n=1 Tax=Litorimonas sp. TaxID=1892381 RepID=UPI003A8A4824